MGWIKVFQPILELTESKTYSDDNLIPRIFCYLSSKDLWLQCTLSIKYYN